MKNYQEFTYGEILDLDKKVKEVIDSPTKFSEDYIDSLIKKVDTLSQSYHQDKYNHQVSWIFSSVS